MTYRPGNCRSCDLFFFLVGARVKEVKRALRYPDRMNFGEKWANFNVVVEMDRNQQRFIAFIVARERRLHADYLTDSRLLAQSRSSILEFHEYARNYFSLQAEVHYRKICIFKRKRKKKNRIQFWAYFAQVQPKERRQQIKR